MSGFEKRDMSGALFRNDQKGNDKAPNSRGYVIIGGVEYELSGWTRESDKAGRWVSLAVKRKDDAPAVGGGQQQFDDDIPF
jgi:uncharacterized protein (DUF736 family)